MAGTAYDRHPTRTLAKDASDLFHLAGCRYWTASLLPALVGTTLAWWLRPPGFSFKWLGAIEFLLLTILLHTGFSFLQALFEGRAPARWPRPWLLGCTSMCIIAAGLLGLHINSGLHLAKSVYEHIFLTWGMATLLAGMLFVVPPLSLRRRVFGEILAAESLGMVPVLGAYLVQAGDLTRKVYLASLPLVAATALWVWTDELIIIADDEKRERQTTVVHLGPCFSGQWGMLALSLLLYATLVLAVLTASVSPWALAAGLSLGLVWRVVTVSWTAHANTTRMLAARRNAFMAHLITCAAIAASPLVAMGR